MVASPPVLPARPMTSHAIVTGSISASNRNLVQEMPSIQRGSSSAPLLARDVSGDIYHFRYKRRMVGAYSKETITGMRLFFQAHDLQVGDQLTIYKERDEVMLLGQVVRPALYFIHFQRAATMPGPVGRLHEGVLIEY